MVFSSVIFLFLFFPVVLTLYFAWPNLRLKNIWLLAASVVFYAWGEPLFVLLMLGSTMLNYGLGRWLDHATAPGQRKWLVALGIIANLGPLLVFKYSAFMVQDLNWALARLGLGTLRPAPVHLPLGISFFTFHALSYLVDVYRGKMAAARRISDLALYIFLFPQLIAGPILRWAAMAPQFVRRATTVEWFAEGVRRFIYGLAKKVLIANTLAVPANQVFSLPSEMLSPTLAWIGVVCYALQIYFDFSGYSDMAIGMGKMFGLEFIENFNFPYSAQSVRDFWHRWHISLSTWFRDYLYFPLGGNRCSPWRTCFNLLVVFFLCGLWHGASWTFVVWGLYHGSFLLLERSIFGRVVAKAPRLLRHAYALLVVVTGWVFFRAESLFQATLFLRAMFGFSGFSLLSQVFEMGCVLQIFLGLRESEADPSLQITTIVLTKQVLAAGLAGALFSIPFGSWLRGELLRLLGSRLGPMLQRLPSAAEPLLLTLLFVVSAACLADGTYNPFIYFRF